MQLARSIAERVVAFPRRRAPFPSGEYCCKRDPALDGSNHAVAIDPCASEKKLASLIKFETDMTVDTKKARPLT